MTDELEIMRVLRQMPTGKLVVQCGMSHYLKLDSITQDTVRQRILVAVGELIEFAGGYQALVTAGVAPALMPAEQMMSQERREEEFLRSLHTVAPPLVTDTGMLTIAPEAVAGSEPSRTTVDIAAQINDIIQRLQRGPYRHLANREINLRSDGQSSMHIEADGQLYGDPDEIEDSDIRLMLKVALREWGRS